MARQTNIKLRRSATAGAIPTTSNLDLGELALNTYDGKLYAKTTEGSLDSVIQVGSSTDSYFKIRKSLVTTLTVKVVTKTANHAYYNQGSSAGYNINGIESPHFNLVPGNTYRFDQSDSSNSGHPLRFYYEADKTTAYTTGVTTNGTPGSSGAYTQIIPTGDTPMCLYYQCSAHGYMGNKASFMTRNFTGFDTDDLTEGSTNLYFTNARARSAISVSGDLSYNSSTGVISFSETTAATTRALISVTDAGGDGSLAYNNSTGVITYTGPSAAEVRAHISAGTGVTVSNGAISIGQAVATSSNVTFADLAATGNVVVTGNLTVNGTQTTLNTATLDVEDLNITVGKAATTSAATDGAGLTFGAWSSGTIPTFTWDHANQRFAANYSIAANLVGNVTGNVSGSAGTVTSISSHDVGDLGNVSSTAASSGQVLKWSGSEWAPAADLSGAANQNLFETIAVSGQSDIVADGVTDTLTFAAGSNITLTTNASTDTITIAASGGGSAITVQDEGSSLSTAAGTINFVGAGVTATGTGATKTVTIPGTGTVSEAFKTIAVSGSSDIVADSATDTLTLVAGSNMTITQNATSDTITFASSGGSSGAAASDILKRFVYTTSGSTTAFSGSDDNSQTLSYTAGAVQVYLNGVLQKLTTDYAETNSTTITFVNAIASGNVVEIVAYYRTIGTGNSVVDQFTGDGSTTAFTVTTAPADEKNLMVYIDGVYQQKTDYTVSGTTLTMDTAPGNGAKIETVSMVGAITESSISGDFTVDTSTLVVDSTNNRVGIGTASPQKTLHVYHATTDRPALIESGDANALIEFKDNSTSNAPAVGATGNNLIIQTGSSATERVRVDSSGNLGIGETSPDGKLHIHQTGSGTLTTIITEDDARKLFIGRDAINCKDLSNNGQVLYLNQAGGNVSISNNLGIGTASPAVALDAGSKTDAIRVPNGTTAQRPTAALGQLRYNTTTSEFEGYAAGAWGKIGGGGDSFGTIAVSGQSNVVAEQENDTLTLAAGAGIVLTTAAGSDTVTIAGGSGSVFTTDFFTASGSGSALLAYTLSTTPSSENELICFIEGVYQNKNSYALSGTTLTFDSGIVAGQEVVVHHVGAGVVGTSPTIDTFTGNGSATAYTLSLTPPNENYVQVYWDGVYQHHSEYSVSGTTLTFTSAAPNGTAIEVHTPSVNGIGTPSDGTVTPAKLSTGGPSWDTNSNFIIGNSYVRSDSTSISSTSASTVASHAVATYRTVKYQVQVTQGSSYHTTELTAIHDGTTVALTEYGTVFTGSSLATFDATISSGNMLLQVTMGSASSSTIKVISSAISV